LLDPANAFDPSGFNRAGWIEPDATLLNGHKRTRNPEPSFRGPFVSLRDETENEQNQRDSFRQAKPSGFAPQS
jgi:hypothetical protein